MGNWASLSDLSLNVINITRFREYRTTAICESVKNLTLAVITVSYHDNSASKVLRLIRRLVNLCSSKIKELTTMIFFDVL